MADKASITDLFMSGKADARMSKTMHISPLRRLTLSLVVTTMLAGSAGSAQQQTPTSAPVPVTRSIAAAPWPAVNANASVDRTAWLYRGSDIPPDAGWRFGALANGLRFAVRPNGVPPGQVTIRLRVDAGSLMEQPQEAGWAHLIEHLTFRESRYLPSGEARRAWQRLGVSFGSDTNASTGATSTIYQLDIPAATPEGFATSMRILSGMIREPVLSDATVSAERPIVVAERRERDGPEFRIETASREHLFAGQLLGERSTIGTEATLNAATGDLVREFHHRWYRPERIVIAIAGDMDPAMLERAIVENFADWRGVGPAPADPDFGTPQTGQVTAQIVVEPSQPMTMTLATMRPWRRVTDNIAYTQGLMLNSLTQLVINRSLEERARRGGQYLAAVVREDKPSRSAEITSLTVIPLENSQWGVALDDARGTVASVLATPPTAEAITREFAEIETYLTREFANAPNEPATKQADDLLNAVDIGETVTSPDHALDIWRSIRALATPQEIQRRMRALFEGDAQRVLMTTPTAIAGGEQALVAFVARPPRVRNAAVDNGRRYTFADFPTLGRPGTILSREPVARFGMDRVELSNGVTALIRNIPIEPNKVRITVRWGGGRQAIAPDAPNLLWAGPGALVESGVAQLDQSALERLVNGRQIGMGFTVEDDAFEMSAETTPADLADQLRLLATKLNAPRWDATPVLRARAARLTSYDLIRNSPMAVLQNDLDGIIYSGDQRFAPPTRAAVEALTPQAFRRFWEPLMRQGPIEVQIFGDLGGVDVDQLLANSFGAMAARPAFIPPSGGGDVRVVAPPASPIIVRHSGGDGQAAVVLSYPTGGGIEGVRTGRALDILAAIFNDRLYDRLRDQSGASYSQAVSSNWSREFAHGSYLFVGGLVRPQDSDLMVRTARAIAAELMAEPVTADELQRAVGPTVEQIARASSGNVFWMVETEGGTRDPRVFGALRTTLSDFQSITPAELQQLARTYLMPERAIPLLILPENIPVPTVTAMVVPGASPASGAPQR